MATKEGDITARRSGSIRIRTVAVVAALLAAPGAVGADWFAVVEAGGVYDDNLGRSELSSDIESDRGLRVLAEGGRVFQLSDGKAATFTGSVESTSFDELAGMEHLVAEVTGSFRKKFGLGAYAPAVHALASAQRLDFDDAKRDGWLYVGEIGWQRRLSERWDLEVAASYEARRADAAEPATVFDQERIGASVLGEVILAGPWSLSLGYDFRNGDVDSNATPNDRIIAAKEASIDDLVFGEGRVVYRLEADVHSLTLGLSRGVTQDSSLLLGYELQVTRARGGIDYESHQVRLSYVYAF